MRILKRRDADALRYRMLSTPGKPNLGDYGGAFDHEYSEVEVFRSETPGQLQTINAQGNYVPPPPDPYFNPVAFTPYPFTTNNTSPNGNGNGSLLILSQNRRRQVLLIQNLSGGSDLYANFGSDAGLGIGLLLVAGQGIVFDSGALGCPNNSVYIYFDSATLVSGIIMEGSPVS